MQSKTVAGLVLLIGILLLLPLIGVSALGSVAENGVTGWAVSIIIIILGIMGLSKN